MLPGIAGEQIKKFGGVRAYVRATGEEAEVFVDP
jgi:hypothetical protein